MLIRHTTDGHLDCISQEQHALLSGVLASAWRPALSPELVQVIGLHDTPWRSIDTSVRLNPETRRPHDFLDWPLDDKIDFYIAGIDQLETIHPFLAHRVSLHYVSFAGTIDARRLQVHELARRQRLEQHLPGLGEDARGDLAWIKFFDVLSLFICLHRPGTQSESLPPWLSPDVWSTTPDSHDVDLAWETNDRLGIAPWPFVSDREMELTLVARSIPDRDYADQPDLDSAWTHARQTISNLRLVPLVI